MAALRPVIRVLPGAMRELRARAGMTQEQLAAAARVSPGMIALIETGRRQPGADLLCRLAGALEVGPDALAFVEEEASPG